MSALLTPDQLRALRRHVEIVEQYDAELAKETARLREHLRYQAESLLDETGRIIAGNDSIWHSLDHHFRGELAAWVCEHNPNLSTLLTPTKIAALISDRFEALQVRAEVKSYVRRAYKTTTPPTEDERLAWDAYREIRACVLELDKVAPGLWAHVPKDADPICGLQDILAWCRQVEQLLSSSTDPPNTPVDAFTSPVDAGLVNAAVASEPNLAIPSGATKKKSARREPRPIELEAYHLSIAGWDQTSIARNLAEKHGRPIAQGTISKWIKEVKKYFFNGDTPSENPPSPKAIPIDPRKLDLGRRPKNYAPPKSSS